MNIAFFHNLPSGGAKRAVFGFVKALVRLGHVIELYIPETANEEYLSLKPYSQNIVIQPVPFTVGGLLKSILKYYQPLKSIMFTIADLEKSQRLLAEKINLSDCDVVFVEQDQFVSSPFLLKYLKKPHIYYCNQPYRKELVVEQLLDNLPNKTKEFFLLHMWRDYIKQKRKIMDRSNALFAKHILTNSFFTRETILREYGLNSSVCYLGIDMDIFNHMNLPRENFVLSVGSGRIAPVMRPKLIIVSNAANLAWKRFIEDLAQSLSVELEILIDISDKELVELYNKAELFLYAPYLEPFGFVPLEAMACGLPVVAVKEGGIRETVVDGKTGVLVDRDHVAFAGAIEELLKNPDHRELLSQNSRKSIDSDWSNDKSCVRLLKFLCFQIKQ
ncbi:MAG: glycosyltransferase family 4 protein [Candidatus Omnitrophica bacterium]|nr:glycosyltransferase family 4 protein [Candidatus Omnitrophota bacterium]